MVRLIQISDEDKGGCCGPRTYQDITLFDSWLSNNAFFTFVYGPTLSAMVALPPLIPNMQAMMDGRFRENPE